MESIAQKKCSKCGKIQPYSEFYANKFTISKKGSNCKECSRISQSEYRARNPEKRQVYRRAHRAKNLEKIKEYERKYYAAHKEQARHNGRRNRLRAHGITLQDYDRLYEIQGGKCAICGSWYEQLNVDHDHETGKVRGLLCSKCNQGIGSLQDSRTILQRAIEYLFGK